MTCELNLVTHNEITFFKLTVSACQNVAENVWPQILNVPNKIPAVILIQFICPTYQYKVA